MSSTSAVAFRTWTPPHPTPLCWSMAWSRPPSCARLAELDRQARAIKVLLRAAVARERRSSAGRLPVPEGRASRRRLRYPPPSSLQVDPAALAPLILRDRRRGGRAARQRSGPRLPDRLAFSEEEAARLLGLEPHRFCAMNGSAACSIGASQVVGRRDQVHARGPRQLLGEEAVRDMSTTNGHIDTLELRPRLPRCRPVGPACGPRWKQAAGGGEPLAPRPWRRRASIMPAGIRSRRSRPRVRTSKNGLRRRRRPASASSAARASRGLECIDFDARRQTTIFPRGATCGRPKCLVLIPRLSVARTPKPRRITSATSAQTFHVPGNTKRAMDPEGHERGTDISRRGVKVATPLAPGCPGAAPTITRESSTLITAVLPRSSAQADHTSRKASPPHPLRYVVRPLAADRGAEAES